MRDVEEPQPLPLPDELVQELERRFAAHRRNRGSAKAWEDVEREVFGD